MDGVSLTVNRVDGEEFEVNLIPHTLGVTTLSRPQPGAKVNLEIDLVARYVERLLSETGRAGPISLFPLGKAKSWESGRVIASRLT